MSKILNQARPQIMEYVDFLDRTAAWLSNDPDYNYYKDVHYCISQLSSSLKDLAQLSVSLSLPENYANSVTSAFSKYQDMVNGLSVNRTASKLEVAIKSCFSDILKIEAGLSKGSLSEKTAFDMLNNISAEMMKIGKTYQQEMVAKGEELDENTLQMARNLDGLIESEKNSINKENVGVIGTEINPIYRTKGNSSLDNLDGEYAEKIKQFNEIKARYEKLLYGDFELTEKEIDDLNNNMRALANICEEIEHRRYDENEIMRIKNKIENLTGDIVARNRLNSANNDEEVCNLQRDIQIANSETCDLGLKIIVALYEDQARLSVENGESISQFGEKTPADVSENALKQYTSTIDSIEYAIPIIKADWGMDVTKLQELANVLQEQKQELSNQNKLSSQN